MNLPFDNPLFLIPISSGLIFMLAGFLMLKFPPKKINGFYGYRTSSSMKTQERWDFSQKCASIEMIKLGALMIVSSIFGLIFEPVGKFGMYFGLTFMILMAVCLLIRVERAIKNNFPKE